MRPTSSSLLYLLGRNPEDCQHFHQDLGDDIRHRCSRSDLGVSLEASEEEFDALEEIHYHISTRRYILGRLREPQRWTNSPK
jgi:hypothetical protein